MSDQAVRVVRPLGAGSLLALGINGIVGVGIFFAPSEVARSVPGYGGALMYLLTAAGLLPVAGVYALLGSRFSVDGGPYVWARAAFGPTVAFFVGWMTYVSALFSTSAVVSGFGRHAAPELGLQGADAARWLAAGAALLLGSTAASGLRPSATAWTGVTVLKLIPLVVLVGLAVVVAGEPGVAAARPGALDLERAALVVVFASQGFEVVPVLAGSARRSELTVPLCTIGSLVGVACLYALIHATCVHVVPALADSPKPLVDAARALGGRGLERLVALGANVSALGIAFGMFVLTPRYLAVLGRPEALGERLGSEDVRRVPQRALWVTVLGVVVVVALGDLGQLFVLSSVAVLSQYLVCAAALGRLAWRREHRLGARHLALLPPVVLAIALAARGAAWGELAVAAGVLGVGALVLAARRTRGASADARN